MQQVEFEICDSIFCCQETQSSEWEREKGCESPFGQLESEDLCVEVADSNQI